MLSVSEKGFGVMWSNRELLQLHVYGKRQTSDSSWEFLKIQNEQIKTGKNKFFE